MAGNTHNDTADKIRTETLKQAHKRVAAALVAKTPLTPSMSRQVAPDLVDAAAPSIRAEHTQQLAGMSGQQATLLGLAAMGVLALDLTVFGVVAARGPRWARPLAAVTIAVHTAFFTVNRRRIERVRAAARAESTPAVK